MEPKLEGSTAQARKRAKHEPTKSWVPVMQPIRQEKPTGPYRKCWQKKQESLCASFVLPIISEVALNTARRPRQSPVVQSFQNPHAWEHLQVFSSFQELSRFNRCFPSTLHFATTKGTQLHTHRTEALCCTTQGLTIQSSFSCSLFSDHLSRRAGGNKLLTGRTFRAT